MSTVMEKVLAGDVLTVARLMRDIDDDIPSAREHLKALYPHTGRAYVIGVTGSPGVGKSTLVDKLIKHLRLRGKTVGVVAIDPSSPFSGGAILGDRVRMRERTLDDGVFIKSLATRGSFGGLSKSTRGAVHLLDAMGKDYIVVETVGVGQDEVDVVKTAHTTVVVLIPGMGDNVQAVKAGILEVGDVFAVNKADLPGADRVAADIAMMLEVNPHPPRLHGWTPPIVQISALSDTGIPELLARIDGHAAHLENLPEETRARKLRERIGGELLEMIKDRLIGGILGKFVENGGLEAAAAEIAAGKIDPYAACEQVVASGLECFKTR